MSLPFWKTNNKINSAKYICVSLFFVLCFVHIFSQRPLWLDENFVYESIRDFSYSRIFGVLKYTQCFPRIYLCCIKFVSGIFNYSVFSLRVLSFAAMVCAFYVWTLIYRKVFKNSWLFVLGVFTFVCSYPMTYYANELKPYSMDVLVSGISCLYLIEQKSIFNPTFALELNDRRETLQEKGPNAKSGFNNDFSWKTYAVVFLLPFTLLFSYAGMFFFWIIGFNFIRYAGLYKRIWKLFLTYFAAVCLSVFLFYNLDLKFTTQASPTASYWNSYFISTGSIASFFETFGEGIRRLATFWFGKGKIFMQFASFLIPFFLYALVRYGIMDIKRNKFRIQSIGSVGFLVFLQLFVSGLLRKYPFTGERITLFFAPFVFYWVIKSIDDLRRVKYAYYLFQISFVGMLVVSYFNTFMIYLLWY